MVKMILAVANKELKQLEEEKEYWLNKEKVSCIYTAAINEEPVIPDYNYIDFARKIEDLDNKAMVIKHAVNLANVTNCVQIDGKTYTIDQLLIRMAQLSARKKTLDNMRKQLPKSRVVHAAYSARSAVSEYQYTNFDVDLIKVEYERISKEIMELQVTLDRFNQTVEIEVEI